MKMKITLLPGDGIGPEVLEQTRRVLELVAAAKNLSISFDEGLIGGAAIDATGAPLPEESLALCRGADAVLLGAVGGPKWSDPTAPVRPEQGLLKLRRTFELFANLRPVRLFDALGDRGPLKSSLMRGVNILFVRELTSGIYFGPQEEENEAGQAYDTMLYSRPEVERIARVAFKAAGKRRGRVSSVDKANVLASMRLWRRCVTQVASDYPSIELEHVLVDACAMYLMQRPASFDVILAPNCFGDILSDEAATLAGSLGLLPSASLGTGSFGVYEPAHGSAPDIAGKGIASPIAMILSAALMLRYSFDLDELARAVENAVTAALDDGFKTADVARADESSHTTSEFTDAVLEHLELSLAE